MLLLVFAKVFSAWWKVYHTLTISKNIGELNYGKRIKDGNSNILLLQHTHLIYPYTTAKHWLLNKKVDKSRQKKKCGIKALYTYITAQQSTHNKISSEWQVYRGDVSNFRWKEGGIELECIKPRIQVYKNDKKVVDTCMEDINFQSFIFPLSFMYKHRFSQFDKVTFMYMTWIQYSQNILQKLTKS